MNNSINILSLEAKDIYGREYLCKEGNLKRYESAFDYSLEYIKLKEEFYKVYRRNGLCFSVNGHNYTNHVINVTFKYSYKVYNKVGKNTYVYHNGKYNLEDCICIINGLIMAIRTDTYVRENRIVHSDYFVYKDNAYHVKGKIPVLYNRMRLREHLYERGFRANGIDFVRWKRSAGASRVGKCLFIDKRLYARMHKWELCGLKVRAGQKIDLAAFESYISLTCSAMIGQLTIEPDEILVIDDYISRFTDKVCAVSLNGNEALEAVPKRAAVENSIWDGQSLLDASLFQGEFRKKGMLVLRNRFFKTCGFNTNIQRFFADNHIRRINGRDATRIKMITTPSSIKYLKFGSLENWLKNLDSKFGVVKYEKEPYYFRGRMVQCHYQLLNTLQFSYAEMEEFVKPSLDYIKLIETIPAVLRYHIRFNPETQATDDLVYAMMGVNDDFTQTKYYAAFRKTLVRSMVKNLKRGHVWVNGNYSTMFGNGLEMLRAAAGLFDGMSVLGVGNVLSLRFAEGETLLGSRSPHITMSNIYLAKNVTNAQYKKYFNLTPEIVCVNAIGENLLQRLCGSDYDSDSLLLTNHPLLVKKAQEIEDKFLVPVNFVKARKIQRFYTDSQKADLDIKTSDNKIGEIVNLSQCLNSQFWHENKNNMALYYEICKLAVLSGVEIDSAKKEYAVNTAYELWTLKRLWAWEKKPYFFKMIMIKNGYKIIDKEKYTYYHTSMDYLQRILNKFDRRKKPAENYKPFYSILKQYDCASQGYYYHKRDEIVSVIRDYKAAIKHYYGENNFAYAVRLKSECMDYLCALRIGKPVMFLLIKLLDSKEYRDIYFILMEYLFRSNNELFISMIKENRIALPTIQEVKNNGDLSIFGHQFVLWKYLTNC